MDSHKWMSQLDMRMVMAASELDDSGAGQKQMSQHIRILQFVCLETLIDQIAQSILPCSASAADPMHVHFIAPAIKSASFDHQQPHSCPSCLSNDCTQ